MVSASRLSPSPSPFPSQTCLSGLTCLGHHPAPHRERAVAAVSQHTRTRLLALGLLHDEAHAQRYDRADFVGLSAWVYPTATPAQLQVCHDWHMWLFCFDDRVDSLDGRYAGRLDEMQQVAVHALASLRDGIAHPEPLALYAHQIREALLGLASARWVRAFADAVEAYLFEGTFVAARHHRDRTVPGVADYIRYRAEDSGLGTVIRLVELLTGRELGDAWHDPEIRQLRRLCAEASALHNDLFSYEKEVLWNHCPNNLVHVVMVERSLAFPEAAAWCIQAINDRYAAYLHQSQRMLQRDPALAPFLEGMRVWIEASADWELASGRYRSPSSPFAELQMA